MKRWEYIVRTVRGTAEQAQEMLDVLGNQGYELVGFAKDSYGNMAYIFKREKR
jgi:hypothetical protein